MSNITIKVKDNHWTISKSNLKEMFPHSLFTTIMELDSSCDTIELTHPSITINIMNYIDTIVKEKSILIATNLSPEELKSAGSYLQIEMFIALSNVMTLLRLFSNPCE